jgi:hypothetical protein
MTRPLKKYTVKEWKKLQKVQETLCKKFDIILTDHRTNTEKMFFIFDTINFKNIAKGIEILNSSLQSFGNSMDKLVIELDKSPNNTVKIWSEPTSSHEEQDKINLDKIWGTKK